MKERKSFTNLFYKICEYIWIKHLLCETIWKKNLILTFFKTKVKKN